jgi:hypothetical protein
MAKNKAFDHSKYKDWIDPNMVIPYEKNAKQHTDRQIKNIANSIRRFGWQQDTVLTTDNVLVIGHGRRLAALKLGCEMPYHVIDKTADELTDEDIRELRIADNQTNAETGLDLSMLDMEIGDLEFEGFDFDFGITAEEKPEAQEEKGGSLRDRYLVPPFSVIYANKPDWLARKRAWVSLGIRSELGRGGDLLTIQGAIRRQTSYLMGGRNEQGIQEQYPVKQLHDKSKAYSDGLIARREEIRGMRYGGTV